MASVQLTSAEEDSQQKTMTVDATEILRQMREDRVDVAVFTAI